MRDPEGSAAASLLSDLNRQRGHPAAAWELVRCRLPVLCRTSPDVVVGAVEGLYKSKMLPEVSGAGRAVVRLGVRKAFGVKGC